MAVITISRQVAALGDEIAAALAKELGYAFIDRQKIEKRIMELGIPEEKLKKYDERKPGFFASLAKDRDEYLDCLQTAVLEAAARNNCILIGRGAYVILDEVPNRLALRFISPNSVRIERLQREFSWNGKQAQARISESDANRAGFHKSFFNIAQEDPSYFHAVLNTGLLDVDGAVRFISRLLKEVIDEKRETAGTAKLTEMLTAQELVNTLVFEHRLNVSFLRASIHGSTVTLQGVADSSALADRAVAIAKTKMPGYTVESAISAVQDFRAYP
jgi:cytidylate kinase